MYFVWVRCCGRWWVFASCCLCVLATWFWWFGCLVTRLFRFVGGCLVCCCGCYCLVKLVGLDVICLVGFSLMLVVWWCRCYRLL